MNRKNFLGRAGAALAGLALGRHIDIAQAVPTATPVVVPPVASRQTLVTSGGLCAPLSPIYEMPALPVRNALPIFTAKRGGISFSDS